MKRSRPQPTKEFVTLVEKHGEGITAWHTNHLSNGPLEGINSLIQAAKARARGYRNNNKIITIVYLTAAKLQLPTLTNPRSFQDQLQSCGDHASSPRSRLRCGSRTQQQR